jgi:hypothetical protein
MNTSIRNRIRFYFLLALTLMLLGTPVLSSARSIQQGP